MPHKSRKAHLAYHRKYRRKHRAEYNAWKRKWRKRNPDKAAASAHRAYKKRKPEHMRKQREWLATPEGAEAHRQYGRDWLKRKLREDPLYTWKAMLWRKYRLRPADFDALFEKQGRRCAICRCRKPDKRGWAVDHDHRTKRVRGILCQHCNSGVGFFRDNPNLLAAAIRYLRRR